MCETCETCETENPWGDLRKMWADADKKAKDWREAGEVKLLEQMNDALNGLKAGGWADAVYCPKDGTRFLAIEAGSTGVFPCYYQGEWPNGSWWAEAHGDLWPSRPVLWKPIPSNAELRGRPLADGPA
jgi:hypothetical protein